MAVRDERFPRLARLTEPTEYRRVFKQSRCRSGDRWLTVLAVPNHLDRARLGMAVSRKAAHHAVVRNRVKRIIRESFRSQKDSLRGLDVVVIARPGIATRDNEQMRKALESHWKQLRRRCEPS